MSTVCYSTDALRMTARTPVSMKTPLISRHRALSISRVGVGLQSSLSQTSVLGRNLRMEAAASEVDTTTTVIENPVAGKKLRIKLKSFSVPSIREAVDMILAAAKQTGATVSGPVPLPTRRRLYCVLRSPHVDKDSREHFEIRTHSRLIDIRQLSAETIDRLIGLDIPAGVDANIKIM